MTVTPSFSLVLRDGRLRVETTHRSAILLVTGDVTRHTAAALRALADEIEAAHPPPEPDPQGRLL